MITYELDIMTWRSKEGAVQEHVDAVKWNTGSPIRICYWHFLLEFWLIDLLERIK